MGKPRQGVGSCSICALSTSRGAPSLSWHRSRRGRRCWSLWPFPLGRAATAFSVTQSSFLGVIHIFQVAVGSRPGEATGTQNPTGVLAQGGAAFWGSGA